MTVRRLLPQPVPPTTAQSAVLRVTWLPVTSGCTPRLSQISRERKIVNRSACILSTTQRGIYRAEHRKLRNG